MCGIVGYWGKVAGGEANIGSTLLGMLNALACRGPDSTGVALFGKVKPNEFVAQVKIGDNGNAVERLREIEERVKKFKAHDFTQCGAYLRFVLTKNEGLKEFIATVEATGSDVEVVSLGRSLEIVKQVGSPSRLENTFGISRFQGRHGIGHTRLSTESIVDLSHSQPFWSHGYPDLAIVHNGHITNYHQLRRCYEQRGTRFYTENDSEIVAVFLADKLSCGSALQVAMESMIVELDGSFSCLVATESALGLVKDAFSFKPLLFAETDRFVAVATEEVAIRAAIPGDFAVREAQAKEVRVWQR
jgi:methylamine---glutamate N-methyltransferase subunit A